MQLLFLLDHILAIVFSCQTSPNSKDVGRDFLKPINNGKESAMNSAQ